MESFIHESSLLGLLLDISSGMKANTLQLLSLNLVLIRKSVRNLSSANLFFLEFKFFENMESLLL